MYERICDLSNDGTQEYTTCIIYKGSINLHTASAIEYYLFTL